MNKEKAEVVCQAVTSSLAAIGFLGGLVAIVGTLTFNALPAAFNPQIGEAFPLGPWVTGLALLLLSLVMGIWTLVNLPPVEKAEVDQVRSDEEKAALKREVSDKMFTRYLIGIGYFLFVDAVVNMVAFAGIAKSGQLSRIFPLGNGGFTGAATGQAAPSFFEQVIQFLNWLQHPDEPVVLMVILMLSLGMALLGALFFFANALWGKFKQPEIHFDRNVFWGGLWFRLAEAIVFTIAVFLFMQFQGSQQAIKYLPMIGLFIGMTVKSSEALIFGLAERLLASITSLVAGPKALSSPTPPAPPKDKQ